MCFSMHFLLKGRILNIGDTNQHSTGLGALVTQAPKNVQQPADGLQFAVNMGKVHFSSVQLLELMQPTKMSLKMSTCPLTLCKLQDKRSSLQSLLLDDRSKNQTKLHGFQHLFNHIFPLMSRKYVCVANEKYKHGRHQFPFPAPKVQSSIAGHLVSF